MTKNKNFNNPFGDLKVPKKKAQKGPKKPIEKLPKAPQKNDRNLFLEEMEGVKKMGKDSKKVTQKVKVPASAPKEMGQISSLAEMIEENWRENPDAQVYFSGEYVEIKFPGCNEEHWKKLKKGKLSYEGHLDLHGLTKIEAKDELKSFILESKRKNRTVILIITGKGKGSPGGVSVLREAVLSWLGSRALSKDVQAFCSAKQADGGLGAFYVLMKKSK